MPLADQINQIRIPLKSKRQLVYETEENNRCRILRNHYATNERVRIAIDNASHCVEECQAEILKVADYMSDRSSLALQQARVRLRGYTAEEMQTFRDVQQQLHNQVKAELDIKRAEFEAYYWRALVERLENYQEIRIFDAGGIDYLHANGEGTAPPKYQPRNQVNEQGKRQLTRVEALELVSRLTRRVSGEKIGARSQPRIKMPNAEQVKSWHMMYSAQCGENTNKSSSSSDSTTRSSTVSRRSDYQTVAQGPRKSEPASLPSQIMRRESIHVARMQRAKTLKQSPVRI